MKRQLETRKLVERAKGILQQSTASPKKKPICGCGMRAAAAPAHAGSGGAIILAEDLSRKSGDIQ